MALPEGRWIHYTELPPAPPDRPLFVEWETYRKEVGRLIEEGREGKFVLIAGTTIVGLWDSWADALAEGRKRFPNQHILVHEIRTFERPLKIGYERQLIVIITA